MNKKELVEQIRKKGSFLCIGLDSDIDKIPGHLKKEKDPVFEFNKQIIDATADLAVAYKPNIAFYESLGPRGWESLARTLEYIPREIFTIADAKRGDIGNTSKKYASTFFSYLDFDAVTISPYMGHDSVTPFLEYEGKWVIVLALTSNTGSGDFQLSSCNGMPLYEKVMRTCLTYKGSERIMFVAGATHPEKFLELRRIAPDSFFLVPGVGAQGGDLDKISKNGVNSEVGLLVNASRSIIFKDDSPDFAKKAREQATGYRDEMRALLQELNIF